MFYSKFLYNQNWNIGFTEDTVESFFEHQALGRVRWMKHNYRDRFFADPFILSTTENRIIVLVEELIFTQVKGHIVKLVIDKVTMRLLERKVVLELDTHLSYPVIYRGGEYVYICPENSAAGKANIYLYDDSTSEVSFVKTLIDEPLADSTIINHNGRYWLLATKVPQTLENAYLYASDAFDGDYTMTGNAPVVSNKGFARPAGNFIVHEDTIYRPAQNCIDRYGGGISIQKVDLMSINSFSEKKMFEIYPNSFRYNLGLHTINFYNGGCVIDGCGYLYPIIGRVLTVLRTIKIKLLSGGLN